MRLQIIISISILLMVSAQILHASQVNTIVKKTEVNLNIYNSQEPFVMAPHLSFEEGTIIANQQGYFPKDAGSENVKAAKVIAIVAAVVVTVYFIWAVSALKNFG